MSATLGLSPGALLYVHLSPECVDRDRLGCLSNNCLFDNGLEGRFLHQALSFHWFHWSKLVHFCKSSFVFHALNSLWGFYGFLYSREPNTIVHFWVMNLKYLPFFWCVSFSCVLRKDFQQMLAVHLGLQPFRLILYSINQVLFKLFLSLLICCLSLLKPT